MSTKTTKQTRKFPAEHWFARWNRTAKKDKMRFILSVCDTFDYDDYPVYCKDERDLAKQRNHYDGRNMQSINEEIKVDSFVVHKDGSVSERTHRELCHKEQSRTF